MRAPWLAKRCLSFYNVRFGIALRHHRLRRNTRIQHVPLAIPQGSYRIRWSTLRTYTLPSTYYTTYHQFAFGWSTQRSSSKHRRQRLMKLNQCESTSESRKQLYHLNHHWKTFMHPAPRRSPRRLAALSEVLRPPCTRRHRHRRCTAARAWRPLGPRRRSPPAWQRMKMRPRARSEAGLSHKPRRRSRHAQDHRSPAPHQLFSYQNCPVAAAR